MHNYFKNPVIRTFFNTANITRLSTLSFNFRHPVQANHSSFTTLAAKVDICPTICDLSNCFHYSEADKIIIELKKIPTTTTTLNLMYNQLNRLNPDEFAKVFAAIPPSVTSLNLSGNFFAYIHDSSRFDSSNSDLLKAVLSAVPSTVTSLNLSGNMLRWYTGRALADAFAAIPGSVTELDLSKNNLHYKEVDELKKALAAIPSTVITLDPSTKLLCRKIASLGKFAEDSTEVGITRNPKENNDALDSSTSPQIKLI